MSSRCLCLVAAVCFILGCIPWWIIQLQVLAIDEKDLRWFALLYLLTLICALVCIFILAWRWIFRVTQDWFGRGVVFLPWLGRGLFLVPLLLVEIYCLLSAYGSMVYVPISG
jgi:hypothetical protein